MKAKVKSKKKVLVTGVFDILHSEHIKFLQKAEALGDYLIIGIESDQRVKKMKGEGRPINPAHIRQENLKKLKLTDQVFILPEKFDQWQDHLNLIKKIKPDFLAVSSHTAHLDKKEAALEAVGGKVIVVHQHNPAISTSKLLKK
jgi:D-glycero-beta-D-manno-heptose 1-phosphate adenylyltransferase